MQKTKHLAFILTLVLSMTSCTTAPAIESTKISSTKTIEATESVKNTLPPADCPVTLPSETTFKAPQPYSTHAPWPGIFWFGTEHLWTALQTNGIWSDLPHTSQGYSQKIMWWSSMFVLRDEPEPALIVFGHRLDAEGQQFEAEGATNAYAEDIGDAMLTGVSIPTKGCWEITGQYKKTGLTFVVWVAP